MDSKEKTKNRDKSKETGSDFPFGDCQEMIEKMKECCGDMAGTVDCCFMMGKIKDEKRDKSEGE
jgi:hypothetical protein